MRMSIVMTIELGTALEIVKLLSNGCLYDGWHRKASDARAALEDVRPLFECLFSVLDLFLLSVDARANDVDFL